MCHFWCKVYEFILEARESLWAHVQRLEGLSLYLLHRYGLEEQGKEGIPLASFLVSKYSGIAYLCE